MKIKTINAFEIFDSRGLPTIRCDMTLSDGTVVSSVVPAIMPGKQEQERIGKGVLKAVDTINTMIAPAFVGKTPSAVEMDLALLSMDGTPTKSLLGPNVILALSMVFYRAHAVMENMELFELIAILCGGETVSLPIPIFTMLSGGLHGQNGLAIQEYQVIPYGAQNFRSAVELSTKLFYVLEQLLKANHKSIVLSEDGGFAPSFTSEVEPLNYLMDTIEQMDMAHDDIFALGINVAATHLYDPKTRLYRFSDDVKTTEQLVGWYQELLQEFPLYSIEDGLQEDDWQGWMSMMEVIGDNVQLIGDDLFAANPERIAYCIERGAANAAIIAPNRLGTITEALQAVKLCQEYGLTVAISHRAGETDDTFIADLAVGSSATHIKAGGCSRTERMARYNRLLAIEDLLLDDMRV